MKYFFYVLAICTSFFTAPISAESAAPRKAKRTVVIFMQACNNLESFAHRNMIDMLKVGSNSNLNILVELHRPGSKAWRYSIEKNNCVAHQVITRNPHPDMSEELVSSMQWAANHFPAEEYFLILWNHGLGVLDPRLNGNCPYYIKRDGLRTGMERTIIPGVTQKENEEEVLPSRASKHKLSNDRGIMFDDERQAYLNNEGLKKAVKTISTKVLGGKKFVLGLDACLMGMMEVMYQVKDHVSYFISSQEFEFAQGWPYGPLMSFLASHFPSNESVGKKVVETFKSYYEKRTHYFTQSSVDMTLLEALKQNIDAVSCNLLIACDQDSNRMHEIIDHARAQCLNFSLPDYIDIDSFYSELETLLRNRNDWNTPQVEQEVIDRLLYLLKTGKGIIKKMVVSNTCGRYLSRATGISIYFPQKSIDPSYIITDFAQQGSWLDFLCRHTTKMR